MFKAASTQVIGISHESSGQPCQDYARTWVSKRSGWAGLVLCDGAGSRPHSQHGAKALCEWFPRWAGQQRDLFESKGGIFAKKLTVGIKKQLENLANESGVDVQDLSSTFIAIVCKRDADGIEFRVFHLGDGVAAIVHPDGQTKISDPENGEFANETVFTTSSQAAQQIKVLRGTAPHGSGFILMSDGTAASLYLKAKSALAPAVSDMLSWLTKETVETVSNALETNVRKILRQKTGDDCSIALLLDCNETAPFESNIEHPQKTAPKTSMTHTIKAPKKLIEVALPLDAINAACAHEKMPGIGAHPRGIHLWWARRPLAAARAVIFSQLVNDPSWKWEMEQPGEIPPGHLKASWAASRKRLFKIIEDLVLWQNTTNQAVLDKARAEIRKSWLEVCELNKEHPDADELFNPEKMPGLHDPFAGGGAIPLEAQRLGLEAYASDLNPVAVLINKAMIEIPPKFAGLPPVNPQAHTKLGGASGTWKGATGIAEDVRHYGEWTRKEAQKRIGHLYPPVEITAEMAQERPDLEQYVGQKLTVIAWIWARTVKSPNPAFSHVDVPLASTFALSSKKGKEAYVEPIIRGSSYEFKVKVGNYDPTVKMGTTVGKRKGFKCLLSESPISYDYIRNEGKRGALGDKLMAIVVEGSRKRIYLSPNKYAEQIAKEVPVEWAPETKLHGKCRVNVSNYGFDTYGDLFTPRQLTALTTLSDLVQEVSNIVKNDALAANFSPDETRIEEGGCGALAYAEAISIYLAFAVDRCADFSNAVTRWASSNEKVMNLFGKQAIPMTWDYPEAAILADVVGGFSPAAEFISKCINKLSGRAQSIAIQADAQSQVLSQNQFISTDPPYYDNIEYADLSDFFYVWLRRNQRNTYPSLFASMVTPKTEELVATPKRHGGRSEAEAFFLDGMKAVMNNLSTRAHPSAPVTIYYAFKQSETKEGAGTTSAGWVTFLTAVVESGFGIVGTWPFRSEQEFRMIGMGANALASSVVLVCRKRPDDAPATSRRAFIRELNKVLPEALDEMTKGAGDDQAPVAPVDLSQAIIGPGMAVYSKYSAVLEADGSAMSVKSALQLINRFLAEDDFDADTSFCLHWFEQYGWKDGIFGEADVLARAKGTSVDGVQAAGVVESGSGKVRLLKWADYPTDWDAAKDKRLPVWEALHQLIRVLKQGGEAQGGLVLAAVEDKSEAIRQLAYRLYTLCERKGWAEDARAYNELITSWTALESAAAKAPKQRELFD